MKFLLIAAFSILTLSTPVLSETKELIKQPIKGSTEVNVRNITPEDNKRLEFGINQSITIPDKNLNHTVQFGWREIDEVGVGSTQYEISTRSRTRLNASLGMDFIKDAEDQMKGSLQIRGPLDAKGNVSGSIGVNRSAFLVSKKTIEQEYTQTTINSAFQIQLNPQTTLNGYYLHQWISDQNNINRTGINIEHKIDKSFYIKPGIGWSSFSFKTKDYNSRNQFNAGVEIGVRFPLSQTLGMQVGIRPTFIQEQDKKDQFVVGGGLGLRYIPDKTNSFEAQFIGTGNGINSTIRYNYQF